MINPYVIIAALIGLAAAMGTSAWLGYDYANTQHEAEVARYNKQITDLKQKLTVDSTKTIVKYVDRVRVVEGEARVVEKFVPVYIRDDERITAGWVCVVNAAIEGRSPAEACRDLDTAATIEATTVAKALNENFAACRANAEQLTATIEFIEGLYK